MDIADVIRRVVQDTGNPTHHSTLGALIADALADAGLAQLGDEQVADYIRDLDDRGNLTTGEIVDALAEAIERDLEEEDEI